MSIGALARSGAVAGLIKLTSAGLAFLMFVVIAMVTDARQFGLFSATYAGASLVRSSPPWASRAPSSGSGRNMRAARTCAPPMD